MYSLEVINAMNTDEGLRHLAGIAVVHVSRQRPGEKKLQEAVMDIAIPLSKGNSDTKTKSEEV